MSENITKCPCCDGLATETVMPPDCQESEPSFFYKTIAAELTSEEWYRNINETYRPATPGDIARIERFRAAAIKAGTEVKG